MRQISVTSVVSVAESVWPLKGKGSSDFRLDTERLHPQDNAMSRNSFEKKVGDQPERWVASLVELAQRRGNSDAVAQRAVQLSRQLSISPWIALAIAERLISLQEARVFDRVGRCKELQAAVLDKRRSMVELRMTLPYAPHFLAVDIMDARPGLAWDVRVVTRILAGVLGSEKKGAEVEPSMQIRERPLEEHAATVDRVLAVMRRTRCDVAMALDVEAGHTTEQFAADYIRQKRALEMEERRLMAPPPEDRFRFPPRRVESDSRRPMFHPGEQHSPSPSFFPRDHWPK
jgi:hypothetical protein